MKKELDNELDSRLTGAWECPHCGSENLINGHRRELQLVLLGDCLTYVSLYTCGQCHLTWEQRIHATVMVTSNTISYDSEGQSGPLCLDCGEALGGNGSVCDDCHQERYDALYGDDDDEHDDDYKPVCSLCKEPSLGVCMYCASCALCCNCNHTDDDDEHGDGSGEQ